MFPFPDIYPRYLPCGHGEYAFGHCYALPCPRYIGNCPAHNANRETGGCIIPYLAETERIEPIKVPREGVPWPVPVILCLFGIGVFLMSLSTWGNRMSNTARAIAAIAGVLLISIGAAWAEARRLSK